MIKNYNREELEKYRVKKAVRRQWLRINPFKTPMHISSIIDTLDLKPGMCILCVEPDGSIGCMRKVYKVTSLPYLNDHFMITFDCEETNFSLDKSKYKNIDMATLK